MNKFVTIGIIILAIVALIFFSKKAKIPILTPEIVESNALIFNDQKPGMVATVPYVKLEKGGYVVVSRKTATGEEQIGSSKYLAPGEYSNLELTLDREIVKGDQIVATIHVESGANQTFDSSADLMAVLDDGKSFIVESEVSADAKTHFSEEELENLLIEAGYTLVEEAPAEDVVSDLIDEINNDDTGTTTPSGEIEDGANSESSTTTQPVINNSDNTIDHTVGGQ